MDPALPGFGRVAERAGGPWSLSTYENLNPWQREAWMNTISRSMIGGVGAIAVMAFGCGAYAQTPAPSTDAMKSGAMASEKPKMSSADKATMKKCKAMTAEAMAADTKCKAFMAAHPDAMSSDKDNPGEKPK
jgi:hypothetical protein